MQNYIAKLSLAFIGIIVIIFIAVTVLASSPEREAQMHALSFAESHVGLADRTLVGQDLEVRPWATGSEFERYRVQGTAAHRTTRDLHTIDAVVQNNGDTWQLILLRVDGRTYYEE